MSMYTHKLPFSKHFITFKKMSEKLMELYLGLDLSRFASLLRLNRVVHYRKLGEKSGLKSGFINYYSHNNNLSQYDKGCK